MMEGRNSKVAFSREKFLKTRGTGIQTHLWTELQSKTKDVHGAHGVHTGEFQMGKLRPQGQVWWRTPVSAVPCSFILGEERELNPTPSQPLWGRQRGA